MYEIFLFISLSFRERFQLGKSANNILFSQSLSVHTQAPGSLISLQRFALYLTVLVYSSFCAHKTIASSKS